MEDTRLKVGIDLDGVLTNFISKYREICIGICGHNLPEISSDWYQSNWGLTKEQHNAAWDVIRNTRNFYLYLERLKDASPSSLSKLEQKVNGIYITTRPPTAGMPIEIQSSMWLERKMLAYHPMVLVAKNKGPITKALGLHKFIDDRPENLLDIYEHSPETKLYLRNQEWNKSFEHPNVIRVGSFDEFVDIVLTESNGSN